MMIAGRKTAFYTNDLLIRIDPDLRSQLVAAAERERTSMSELIRRAVRSALAGQAFANGKQRQPIHKTR